MSSRRIKAQPLDAEAIETVSKTVKTSLLNDRSFVQSLSSALANSSESKELSVNSLNSAEANISFLSTDTITSDIGGFASVTSNTSTFEELNCTHLQSTSGSFDYIHGKLGHFTVMLADNLDFPSNIIISNLNVSDTLIGTNICTSKMSGGTIYCDSTSGTVAFFESVTGSNGTFDSVSADSGRFSELSSNEFVIQNISANTISGANSYIENITGGKIYSDSISGSSGFFTDLISRKIRSSKISAIVMTGSSGYFSNIYGSDIHSLSRISTNSLTGNSACFNNIFSSDLSSSKLTSKELYGDNASFDTCSAQQISSCSFTGGSAFFSDISCSNSAQLNSLVSSFASFNDVSVNEITGSDIYVNNLTVSSQIKSPLCLTDSLSGNSAFFTKAYATTIQGNVSSFSSCSAETMTFETSTGSDIYTSHTSSTTITGASAFFDNLNTCVMTGNSLSASLISTSRLKGISASLDDLDITDRITSANVYASRGSIRTVACSSLTGDSAVFSNIRCPEITGVSALSSSFIRASKLEAESLFGGTAFFSSCSVQEMSCPSLTGTSAFLSSITALESMGTDGLVTSGGLKTYNIFSPTGSISFNSLSGETVTIGTFTPDVNNFNSSWTTITVREMPNCLFNVSDDMKKISSYSPNSVWTGKHYISNDGGLSWYPCTGTYSENSTCDMNGGISVSRDGSLWIASRTSTGSDGGIYRSTDGVMFSQVLSVPMTGGSCCSISGNNQKIIVCGSSFCISRDGGVTWKISLSYLTGGDGFFGSSISYDGKYMLILDKGGVFASVDYGDTWNLRWIGSYKQTAMSRNGSHMYICSLENFLFSLDYGMTWIANSPSPNYGYSAITCDETGRYVYMTGDGSNNLLWISKDYGKSFTMISVEGMTGVTTDVNVSSDGSKIMLFDGTEIWFKTITNFSEPTGRLTVNGVINYDSSTGCNIFASSGTFDYVNGGIGRFSIMMADNFKFPPNEIFENILFTNSLTGASAFFTSNTSVNLYGSLVSTSQLTGTSAFFDSITGTNIFSSSLICDSALLVSIMGIDISASSFTGSVGSFNEIIGTSIRSSECSATSYTGHHSWIEEGTVYSLTGHQCYSEVNSSHEIIGHNCSLDNLTCNTTTGAFGYIDCINTNVITGSLCSFNDVIGTKTSVGVITGVSAFFTSITGAFVSISQLETPLIIGDSAFITTITGTNAYASSLSVNSTTGDSAFFTKITTSDTNCVSLKGNNAHFSGIITGYNIYSSGNYLDFNESKEISSSVGTIRTQMYDPTSISFIRTINLGEKLSSDSRGLNRFASDKKHLYVSSNRDLTKGKVSHDGGLTWNSDDNSSKSAVGMSRDGRYVLTYNSLTSTILVSDNYGHSYNVKYSYTGGNTKRGNCLCGCCVSDTGKYMGCIFYSGGLQISRDYGNTWSSSIGSPPTTYCYQTCCIACSHDAKYWITYVGAGIYVSNNYGASFSVPYSTTGNARTASSVCMSRNGKYMYVLCAYDPSNPTFNGAWKSSNYGISWNQMKDNSVRYVSMTCDASGKYVVIAENEGLVEMSDDYCNSFATTITLPHPSIYIFLSDDGSVFYSLSSENCIDVYKSNKKTGEYDEGMLQVQGDSYLTDIYCDSLSGKSMHVSFDSSSYMSSQDYIWSGTGYLTSVLSSKIFTDNLIVGTPDLSKSLEVIDMTGYTSGWTSTNVVPPPFASPIRQVVEGDETIAEEEESHSRISCSDDFTIRVNRVYCSAMQGSTGYISLDSGISWSPIRESDSGNSLQMNCCSSVSRDGTHGISYRCASIIEWGGIFVSSDNCNTWHRSLALDCVEIVSNGISGNNRCMLCIDRKGYYWIYDGNTWRSSNISAVKIDIVDCSLSYNGQFMVASQQGGMWVSRNFGRDWSFYLFHTTSDSESEDSGYFSISISDDGKYMYSCCTNGIYCSGDYGYSWKKIKVGESGISSVCCDMSGKYITTNTKTKFYASDNYGTSFDFVSSFGTLLEDEEVAVGAFLEDTFINKNGTKCIIVDTDEINPRHWIKVNSLHKTSPFCGGIYCGGTGAFLCVSTDTVSTNSLNSTGSMLIKGENIYVRSTGKICLGNCISVERGNTSVGSITSPCYSFSRVSAVQSLSFRAAKSWKTVPLMNNGYSIAWSSELGIMVVVNHSSIVQISSNGLSWVTTSCPNGNWSSVCWSPETSLFLACGSGGFMHSSDGRTWTIFSESTHVRTGYYLSGSRLLAQSDRPVGLAPTSVCYGAGLDKKYIAVTGTTTFFSSEDGLSWTSSISDVPTGSFVCFAQELGIYCSVGNSSSIFDGEVWKSSSTFETPLNSVVWIPDILLFVAVGIGSILTSPDGLNWTEQKCPCDSFWSNVCYSPELHLIVAITGSTVNNRIAYSYNSNDWFVTIPPENNTWRGLCWARELGIFVSTSIDGDHKAMVSKYVRRCF